jgi:hypothetical protein
MPITVKEWGLSNAFTDETIQLNGCYIDQSSTLVTDQVIYPFVPDTVSQPYYDWHFSKLPSDPNQRNRYGYNERFEQLILGTYTCPYPTLIPNSTTPQGWRFEVTNPNKIYQSAVASKQKCFTETNFEHIIRVNFQNVWQNIDNNCNGQNHFFLSDLPFIGPTAPQDPICDSIPEICTGRNNNGGTNNNTGGNGGYTSGSLCNYAYADTGAKHTIVISLSDNDLFDLNLVLAIEYYILTLTDGAKRTFGHHIRTVIADQNNAPYITVHNTPDIESISFKINVSGSQTRVTIIEETNTKTNHYEVPNTYSIQYPQKYIVFNLLSVFNNGYLNTTDEYLPDYEVVKIDTQPKKVSFVIDSNIYSNAQELRFKSQRHNPPTDVDHLTSVSYSLQLTPNIFLPAQKNGNEWVISNISSINEVKSVRFESSVPIETIRATASAPDDPPPEPPINEVKTKFFERLQRFGYRVGPFERGTPVTDCFVSSVAFTSEINKKTLDRFGPLVSLRFLDDIRHPDHEAFRYLFIDRYKELTVREAAGRSGPGYKLETYHIEINNWNYETDGYDIGYTQLYNSYTKGTPIFVDVQPIENPDMYFPAYSWQTDKIKIYRYDGNTQSFVEIEPNTPVNMTLAILAIFKTL